jgi:hypothetical protein
MAMKPSRRDTANEQWTAMEHLHGNTNEQWMAMEPLYGNTASE